MTVSKFLCELATRSVAECQLLNQWIRGVNQDSAKFIKNQGLQSCIAFCATSDDVVKKKMSDLVRSSGVRCADVAGANRGAVRVTGNLLAFGRALSVVRVSHLRHNG